MTGITTIRGLLHLDYSFHIVSSGFNHVTACDRISFLFKAEYYSIVCVYLLLFTHLPVDRYLRCSYLLAIRSRATVNMDVRICIPVPTSQYPRSGIPESNGNSTFNFLRNRHHVSHRVASFYISTNSVQILHSSPIFVV